MNVLVTGGAGYIGSVTTAQLVEAGHQVVVYDNLSHGHRDAVHKDARLIEGDIADQTKLQQVFREHKIEAVMHFAAIIEAGESMKVPEKYFRNNTTSTFALLETMLAEGINKFVFSSTAAVYGNPETTPIREDATLQPINAYGASKHLVEQVLAWYNQVHGFRYAALRYFNACGSTANLGEHHQPESHLIPLAIQATLGKREKLKLFGSDYPTKDGTCVRDYVHVSDLADAHLRALNALETQEKGKLIYNLGSQSGFSNKEVIEAVGKVMGMPVPWEEAPRRDGDPATLIASSEKIQKELGWKPRYTDIAEIISTAYEWFQKHPNGYQN